MAIDSRAKRLSMLSFGGADLLPDPDTSGLSASERATLLGLYAGITISLGTTAYTTTMGDLLTDIKYLLRNNITEGNDLFGIKLVKRGILPERNQFPLITILPKTERIVKRLSGRRVVVQRDVEVFVITQLSRGKPDIYFIQGLADATQELLRTNSQLPRSTSAQVSTLAAEFSPIELSADASVATFVATYYSHEDLPNRSFSGTQADNASPVTIRDQAYTLLNNLKATTLADVREVLKEDWEEGKRQLLPSIVVSLDSQDQHIFWAGQDRIVSKLYIKLYSRVASAADETLMKHLEILEPIKEALFAVGDWTARVMNVDIVNIEFGQSPPIERSDLMYETEITVESIAKQLVA